MCASESQNELSEYLRRRRAVLRRRRDCTFVDRDEFLHLLVSRRRLVRASQWAADVDGVFEVETGHHYFIERERLWAS